MRLLVTGLLLVSCGSEMPQTPPIDRTPESIRITEALCEARLVADRSIQEARRIFLDAVHDPLHELARDVTSKDARLAARLLRAKEQIESDLDSAAPKGVTRHFDRLISATNDVLQELERESAC